jgi:hypothetical protein
MIRRPGHLVNDGLTIDDTAPLPTADRLDVPLSIENVEGWGGDPRLYRHFLTRSLLQPDAEVLTSAALAAWRAGVIDIREDALGRLEVAGPASAAAALGVDPGELGPFIHAQRQNRFALSPASESGLTVARVGGFRGLGGVFTSPPLAATSLGRAGGFAVHTASGDWEYDADVFGGRLRAVESAGDTGPVSGAVMTTSPLSYLATVVLA